MSAFYVAIKSFRHKGAKKNREELHLSANYIFSMDFSDSLYIFEYIKKQTIHDRTIDIVINL